MLFVFLYLYMLPEVSTAFLDQTKGKKAIPSETTS